MLRRSRGIRKGIIAAVALALVATVLTFSWWWPLAQGLWRLFHAQSDEIQLVEAVVALLLLIVSPIIRLISGGNATSDLGRALEEPVRVLSDEELMSRYPDRVKGIFVARGALNAAMLRQWERLLLVGRSGIGKTTGGRELILRVRHVGEVDTALEPTEGFAHLGSETLRLRLRQMVPAAHRVLLWLDDLPHHFSAGGGLEREEMAGLGQIIDCLTSHCKALYVVVTARDEHLEPAHRAFLKEHHFRKIPLPDFSAEQTGRLVDGGAGALGLRVEEEGRQVLIEERDGTPLNTVLALQGLRSRGQTYVGREEAEASARRSVRDTWELQYRDIIRARPLCEHLLAALGILDTARMVAYSPLVLRLAGRLVPRRRGAWGLWQPGSSRAPCGAPWLISGTSGSRKARGLCAITRLRQRAEAISRGPGRPRRGGLRLGPAVAGALAPAAAGLGLPGNGLQFAAQSG